MNMKIPVPKAILVCISLLSCSVTLAQWNTNGTNINNTNTGNVGIGISTPAEKLHINGAIRGNGTGGKLVVSTGNGTISLGPRNLDWAHIETDLPKFYFNKPIYIDGAVSSYNTLNLLLQTNGTTRMILNANGNVGIGNTNPQKKLEVNSGVND